MMADMLASGLNPHLAGFNQAPALVEKQVLAWLASLMGFPSNASGLLVTGGSMANVLGVTVARYAALRAVGYDVRELGLQPGPGGPSLHGWSATDPARLMAGPGRQSSCSGSATLRSAGCRSVPTTGWISPLSGRRLRAIERRGRCPAA